MAKNILFMEYLVAAFRRSPEKLVVGVMALQLVLWTLLPSLLFASVPIDVAENIAWGQEWQLGYYKHPPLQAWLTEAAFAISGNSACSIYFLSQIAVISTFWAIFVFGRRIAGPGLGLLSVVLYSVSFYASASTPEFNANVLQIPIWAWATVLLWYALEKGATRWWFLLGLTLGLGMLAKYSMALAVFSLLGAGVAIPEGRRALRTPGPYVAAGTAFLVWLPNLIWLFSSDFLPLVYVSERASELTGIQRLAEPLRFLSAQLFDCGLCILVLAAGGALVGGWRSRMENGVAFNSSSSARRYAVLAGALPLALTVILGIAAGRQIRDMWAAPMLTFVPLAVLLLMRTSYLEAKLRTMLGVWLAAFLCLPFVTGLISPLSVLVPSMAPQRSAWPSPALAYELTSIWHSLTGSPLTIVGGNAWGSNITATYSVDHPSVFVDADFAKNPWITRSRIEREGALLLWESGSPMPAVIAALGPFARTGEVTKAFALQSRRTVGFNWAILAPKISNGGALSP